MPVSMEAQRWRGVHKGNNKQLVGPPYPSRGRCSYISLILLGAQRQHEHRHDGHEGVLGWCTRFNASKRTGWCTRFF